MRKRRPTEHRAPESPRCRDLAVARSLSARLASAPGPARTSSGARATPELRDEAGHGKFQSGALAAQPGLCTVCPHRAECVAVPPKRDSSASSTRPAHSFSDCLAIALASSCKAAHSVRPRTRLLAQGSRSSRLCLCWEELVCVQAVVVSCSSIQASASAGSRSRARPISAERSLRALL